ncbi:MAG: zinc metallopeptidase [Eubacteriales bacterium]
MTIFGYYFESYYLYIVLVLPCVIWAMIAQIRVQSAYGKFSRVRTARGLTGAETAGKNSPLAGDNKRRDCSLQGSALRPLRPPLKHGFSFGGRL